MQHSGKSLQWILAPVLALALLFCAPPRTVAQEITEKFAAFDPASTRTVDHSAWQALLDAYVTAGKDGLNRVDYARLKAEGAQALDRYLATLQHIDVASLNRAEQFAYWVNLYNAKTVAIVAEHYPVASIREIRLSGILSLGPWKEKVVTVSGVALSLDDIEHLILRPVWSDPRVHYAVNCAAIGCPNLPRVAFTGAALESLLDEGARAFVNSERGVKVQSDGIVASKIYSWFEDDFGDGTAGVLAHMRRYASAGLAKRLVGVTEIAGYAYNWGLND